MMVRWKLEWNFTSGRWRDRAQRNHRSSSPLVRVCCSNPWSKRHTVVEHFLTSYKLFLKSVPPLCVTSSECRAMFQVENLAFSWCQKRKKNTRKTARDYAKSQPFIIHKPANFEEPVSKTRTDVDTVLHFDVFAYVDAQLQAGQAAARGPERKAVIRTISGVGHRGVTNLSASIWSTVEMHCTVFRHVMQWGLFIFISRESKWGTLQSAGNPRCAVPAEIHSICTDRPRPGPAAGLQVSPTSDTSQSVAILMNRPHCRNWFCVRKALWPWFTPDQEKKSLSNIGQQGTKAENLAWHSTGKQQSHSLNQCQKLVIHLWPFVDSLRDLAKLVRPL